MSARPPLPPRRSVPPPPPRESQERERAAQPPPPRRNVAPPPLPPRSSSLLKALSRRPPPPPIPKPLEQPAPAIPARRLPPMPTRLPTPPPEPEYDDDEEYQQSDEGYQSQEESCLKCFDFSQVDEHAALFPRRTVSSVQQLAYDLTAPFESETEKARAIFFWLHLNVDYDTVAFFSGNLKPATADNVLQSGLAVCDGYAGLFAALAGHAGLQAHKVGGHGKGFGYAPLVPGAPVPREDPTGHAWNAVCLDGEWRLLDACWGAGALMGGAYTRRFAPVWFISTPAEFGKRHYPEDPSYQLIGDADGGPVSWEDYICAPEGPTVYGDFYSQDFLQDLLQPATQEIEGGQWASFQLFKQCEHMSREQADNYVYFINTPDDTKTTLEVNAEGGWSAQIYMPRSRGDVSLNFVTKFDGRDAKGLSPEVFKNSIGRKSMAWQGLCKWTLV
ncbi:hypothetical protein C8R43DRAFT_895351 [Mycena crocata]|nr:hypothetical protein C8R43DRAFT_895351 [Mycena crocata]